MLTIDLDAELFEFFSVVHLVEKKPCQTCGERDQDDDLLF